MLKDSKIWPCGTGSTCGTVHINTRSTCGTCEGCWCGGAVCARRGGRHAQPQRRQRKPAAGGRQRRRQGRAAGSRQQAAGSGQHNRQAGRGTAPGWPRHRHTWPPDRREAGGGCGSGTKERLSAPGRGLPDRRPASIIIRGARRQPQGLATGRAGGLLAGLGRCSSPPRRRYRCTGGPAPAPCPAVPARYGGGRQVVCVWVRGMVVRVERAARRAAGWQAGKGAGRQTGGQAGRRAAPAQDAAPLPTCAPTMPCPPKKLASRRYMCMEPPLPCGTRRGTGCSTAHKSALASSGLGNWRRPRRRRPAASERLPWRRPWCAPSAPR